MKNLEAMKAMVINRNFAVYDPLFTKALREIPWADWHSENRPFYCREAYLEKFRAWIASTRLNRITGLDRFRTAHLINGTTQSFDEAYFRHRDKRLRFFRGEYAYHRRILGTAPFLDNAPLAAGDYVIISAPFCSTGSMHPEFYSMLAQAEKLHVPVMVDCAYFGTCADFSLDLSSPAIESVSFSLTKGLGLGDIRSGVRFSNIQDQNPIAQQNTYDHSVLGAARIGLHMMNQFGPDHIPERFFEAQRSACRDLGITPSPCMHLALGGAEWNHFRVDDKYNTLGIRELVKARFQQRI